MLFRFLARQWIHATASRVVERAVRQARAPSEQEDEPEQEHLASQLPPCDVAVICADPTESMGLRGLLEDVLTTRCASLVEHAGQLAGRQVVIAEGGSGSKSGNGNGGYHPDAPAPLGDRCRVCHGPGRGA